MAISALNSFCRNAREGRFPQLSDSDGLWRLLIVITARKVLHLVRDEARQKRCRTRSPVERAESQNGRVAIDELVGNEPTPDFAAQVAEQYERLLGLLDEEQRMIAIAKLEGLTNAEIAAQMQRTGRTIERKLRLIRAIWEQADAA